MKNILECIERAAHFSPEKTAFTDDKHSVSYKALLEKSKSIGTALLSLKAQNKPIAVFIDKSVETLTAFFGVVYSGNFYVVIDTHMPSDRINTIFKTLSPVAVLTDEQELEKARELDFHGEIFTVEQASECCANEEKLQEIRQNMIDTDPLYALFTSGSTGVPKGVVISHRNVLAYSDWVVKTFQITGETVFGNQTPFYFSMSVTDVFSTIRAGATLHIIPKTLFSFPIKLLEYLRDKKVNTIYWVPSALCIVANWKALDYVEVPDLKKVLFAGEVMPTKQLNMLMEKLPGVLFANLYGPTETTDICTYYTVNRKFSDDEPLPIGNACNNCDVFVLKDDGTQAPAGEEGELCVRGSFLALGYYNNPDQTKKAFVQNPLNTCYPEVVYKTGDIVKYNEHGELIYVTRKDFQIKHMGYRIELGEIETAVNAVDGLSGCCCVYDNKKEKLVLVYTGEHIDDKYLMEHISKRLPDYMRPNKLIKVAQMPHNANGKIDRKWIKSNYKTLKNRARKG